MRIYITFPLESARAKHYTYLDCKSDNFAIADHEARLMCVATYGHSGWVSTYTDLDKLGANKYGLTYLPFGVLNPIKS